MDTRRQQVYGRRRRKNAQDLQLFADLLESSPAKASIQLTQQDEGFHENHERLVENLQSENSNSTIDIVAQQMKSLALGRVITAPQEQTKAASQVLKDRSVNSQTLAANEESKKPRIRRSRAPGVTKPIVEVKEPVALVHNELETLAVVLEDLHLPHLPGGTNATAVTEESDPSKERQEAPILRSSRKTGKQSIVAKPKPLPLELIEYAKPLLSLCSDTFNSSAPSGFQDWSDSLARYFDIIKIAEASYGEVYRLSLRTSKAVFGKGDESVLKLIALKPPPALRPMSGMTAAQKGKVANMSEMVDVASEVRLLQRMSPVPGFTNFRDVRVMRGRLPTHFVTAWRHFHKNVKKSCFPDPGRKTTHDEDQLWAVVEMQDAGKDLETVPVESEAMCWDAFWGVAIALAKGEEWAEFEHRDLHLGNICVRWKASSSESEAKQQTVRQQKLGSSGVETTIIDYTLSRARMSLSTPRSSARNSFAKSDQSSETAYFDLSKDLAIFQGDASEEYQYDIYRAMRSAVFLDDPAASTLEPQKQPKSRKKKTSKAVLELTEESESAAWRRYTPLTNLVWLHFVLHEMAKQLPANTKVVFSSEKASDGNAATTPFDIRPKLRMLQDMLELDALGKDSRKVESARQLVEWAVAEAWLDEEDVVGPITAEDDLDEVPVKPASSRQRKPRKEKAAVKEREDDGDVKG